MRIFRSLPLNAFASVFLLLAACQKSGTDDELGRQTCDLQTIKDDKTPATVLMSVAFGAAGLPTSLTYDGGTFAVSHTNGLPNQVVATGGDYNETYVNAFDGNKRLTLTTVTGASPVANRTIAYTYDGEGRLTKIDIATTGVSPTTVSYRLEYEAKNATKVFFTDPGKPEELALEGTTFSGSVPMATLKNILLPVVANRLRSTAGFRLVPLFADLNSAALAQTQKRYLLARLEATDTRTVNKNANGLTSQVVTESRNASNVVVASSVQVFEYLCR